MATSTIIIEGSSTESFMLPGMASPEPDASGRLVRFDKECVLIPELVSKAKLPLVVTKSVALPLWKRRGYPTSDSEVEDPLGSSPQLASSPPEESRVVIKVPIPLYVVNHSRRYFLLIICVQIQEEVIKIADAGSISVVFAELPLSPVRRASDSYSVYHRRKEDATIPLRACCEACERATEASLKEGDKWEEKFTRGARRRRSASLDNNDINSLFRLPSQHNKTSSFPAEFSALSTAIDSIEDSERYGSTPTFALTVDEVDKRRKSIDLGKETPPLFIPVSSSSNVESGTGYPFPSPGSRYSADSKYTRLSRPYDREVSSSSGSSSSASDELLLPDILDSRHRLRSSPIEEEDEAQLFPLPSPRRSPASTPSPSNSPRVSPVPSPNGSTSCLPSSSKDNMPLKNSSQESLLRASLSRKLPATYLSAPTLSIPRKVSPTSTRSSSPLATAPKDTILPSATVTTVTSVKRVSLHGLNIPTAPTPEERASANPLSPKGPRPPLVRKGSGKETPTPPSSEGHSRSNTPSVSHTTPLVPVRAATIATSTITSTITTSGSSIPSASSAPFPSHTRHPSSPTEPITINTSHTMLSFHSRSTSTGTSISSSPPSAGVGAGNVHGASPGKRKHSFTLPFIRAGEALREVSADVLRGVSSISGGAGVVGSV
ncbi:hypothetical protein CVT26_003651 [Gymnopilus dilepis]|uniref:Uncharacterized protein n=1 Tax=Gymnopilus dilepis TaxID=231916 RepID=A0A409VSG7_9AGAR|nr:hypothetical protein CVT26_003651 [Gymnopilus dilepis]